MAVTKAGTAINCVDADTVAGPIELVAIHNDATTSATLTVNGVVIWSAGSTKETHPFEWRASQGETLTIAVTGGGSITLFERVR